MSDQNLIVRGSGLEPEKLPESASNFKRIVVDTDGESLALRLLRFNSSTATDPATWDGATYGDLEKVRNFPQRKWNEREGAWIVPLTDPNVTHLLGSWSNGELEFTDGGRLIVDYHVKTKMVADHKLAERMAFMSDGKVQNPEGYIYATQPFDHQKIAFSSARGAEYFALLMEMGTGKTKVVVDVICDRARRQLEKWERGDKATPRPQFRALIVAPKTVTHNWLLELEKHSTVEMSVERLKGGKLGRVERLVNLIRDHDTPILVGIINYEGLDIMEEALTAVPWDLMVLDESIWIKNPSAKRSKAAKRVGESAKSRFILTGLPITKDVLDLYGQFDFLKSGSLGYTSYYAYANHFSERNHWGGAGAWKKDKLPELQERLARFSFIIRRAQCVDLPPKIYQTMEIDMGDEQAAAYDQMLNNMIVDLESLDDKQAREAADAIVEDAVEGLSGMSEQDFGGRFSVARIILVKLLRLSQITSGFVKMADGTLHRFPQNPKIEAIRELLEETDDSDKIIVWSRFVDDLKRVEQEFNSKYGVALFYGGLNDRERENNIERFKKNPRCRVFAGQPQSGGFGINLTEANHVVYISNDYSLQNRAQSEDRCHRIGQTRNVTYTDLVVPNSIDALITARIKQKKDLADLLTDRKKIVEALKIQLLARRQEAE